MKYVINEEYSKLNPILNNLDYESLRTSIERYGMETPITILSDGTILDGHNRYKIWRELGRDEGKIKHVVKEFQTEYEIKKYILETSLTRRNLNTAQRIEQVFKLEELEKANAKERQGTRTDIVNISSRSQDVEFGKTRDKLAEKAGVSHFTLGHAKELMEEEPELWEDVKEGTKTINTAYKRMKQKQKPVTTPEIKEGKYRIIYADPPWKYGDKLTEDYGGAEHHYPAMTLNEICELDVDKMTDDNAVLFLWTTSPLLEDSFKVIKSWGFKYKTSFVWDKVKHNFGHYNSVRHEFLLVCTKGSCTPDNLKLFDSVQIIEKTSKHSEKPEEFRDIIDTLYTSGSRIEMFSRKTKEEINKTAKVKTWNVWGSSNVEKIKEDEFKENVIEFDDFAV